MRYVLWMMGVLLAAAYATYVSGQEHQHPPQDMEIHERFYSNWMRPDDPTASCCSNYDCYPTTFKNVGGTWFFKHRETGQWWVVPTDKIENFRRDPENARESPDGRSHICAGALHQVYCGVLGIEG